MQARYVHLHARRGHAVMDFSQGPELPLLIHALQGEVDNRDCSRDITISYASNGDVLWTYTLDHMKAAPLERLSFAVGLTAMLHNAKDVAVRVIASEQRSARMSV